MHGPNAGSDRDPGRFVTGNAARSRGQSPNPDYSAQAQVWVIEALPPRIALPVPSCKQHPAGSLANPAALTEENAPC